MDSTNKSRTSDGQYYDYRFEICVVLFLTTAFLCLILYSCTDTGNEGAAKDSKPTCIAAFREDFTETFLRIDGRVFKGKLKILDNSRPYYVAFSYQLPDGAIEAAIDQQVVANNTKNWSVRYRLSNTLYAYLIPWTAEWPDCNETVLISDFTATLPQ